MKLQQNSVTARKVAGKIRSQGADRTLGDQDTPEGQRLLDAEAEEGEEGFDQDRLRDGEPRQDGRKPGNAA